MIATVSRGSRNTRQKILQAAFEEFYRNGFQAGSLNQIVDSAGATKGAMFHHFENKNDLGYAVVNEIIGPELKERWIDPLSASIDPVTDLKRMLRQCMKEEIANGKFVQGCPLNNLAQEMSPLDEGFRKCIDKIYSSWRDCLTAAFARGIKAGTVKEGISPHRVAAFIVAAQAGIVGTGKNAQSEKLMADAGAILFEYLDSLRP